MRRRSLALAALAVGGWLGALVSHLVAMRADDEEALKQWTLRRNQFLLLSSLCMNTLVLSTVYRYAKKRRQRGICAG